MLRTSNRRLLASLMLISIGLSFVPLCLTSENAKPSRTNSTRLLEQLSDLNGCLSQSVYSFIMKSSKPPTSIDALKETCRQQMEGQRCLREKTKSLQAILKRGMQTFTQNRVRHTRKICTNFNGEASRDFVATMKCVTEKKFPSYKRLDSILTNRLLEIKRLNFNDSALELKYICCSLVEYRKGLVDNLGSECAAHRSVIEEFSASVVPSDLSLICEEEDKLLGRICPALKPLNVTDKLKFADEAIGMEINSPSITGLYLIATLGEAEDR